MRLSVMYSDRERPVLVQVEDSTTAAELAEALDIDPAHLGCITAAIDPSVPISHTSLLNGSTIPLPRFNAPSAGAVRLEIVGGPLSGQTVRLSGEDRFVIGSGASANLRIADERLSEVHVSFDVGAAGVDSEEGQPIPILALVAPSPGCSVFVNGVEITSPTRIAPIDLVQIGSSIVRLGLEPTSDADLTADPRGMRGFNRPSRIRSSDPLPNVTLHRAQPEATERSPLAWLAALVPVVLGITMAVVFQRPIMLLMAAASPIMIIGSYLINKRQARNKDERAEARWREEVAATEDRIASLVRMQRADAWYDQPDPLRVKDIAVKPLTRLWERRFSAPDALVIRIGTGELPLKAQFRGGVHSDDLLEVGVAPAPITVDLSNGPVGIAGSSSSTRPVARSMVAGLVTLRSPRDLRLIVLCDELGEPDWGWAAWLPHVASDSGPAAMIGNTDATRRDRLRELALIIGQRKRFAHGSHFAEHIVVLVDGARDLRRLPGMTEVLTDGPSVGVHVIALDTDRSRLPEECYSLVLVDGAGASRARLESNDLFIPSLLLDGMSPADANDIARSLCSIEHVSGAGDESALPAAVRYIEIAGININDPGALLQRWNTAPRQTYIPVGATAESEFAFDLAADGPHALVAGTTGSGKSEFLQTLIVSLALSNRPDTVNFVLVDYKGGSAFSDCERLPHTVGMVTNLDARETQRALASLDAELKRRERALRAMGAKDIDAAWKRDSEAASKHRLARLVIVIDEFAELKTELPEFIAGLVRIARVGRSLGVHLVLATQRPSGVVTPEMQSNINLRIALRVTDRSDSIDILGTADAASISPSFPGRGFMRSVAGGHPVAFQTARVTELSPGTQPETLTRLPVAELNWEQIGSAPNFPRPPEVRPQSGGLLDHDDTDLHALVELTIRAAKIGGIAQSASPWLHPLPEILPLDAVRSAPVARGDIILGLMDLPEQQAQRPLTWNPADNGHLLFVGGARSGRTSALRSLLAQSVTRYSPPDLHLYIADYGNGELLPFAASPHCGAVVSQVDHERLPRLIQRLLRDLEHRQSVLSSAGVPNVREQRARSTPQDALSYAIFAIDGWERLLTIYSTDELITFREQVLRLLREGPAVGICLIMTADRTFIGDRIASAIDTQYLLPMRDPNDYRAAGVMIRDLPASFVPGRMLFGAEAHEAQLAVLSRDPSNEGQAKALHQYIDASRGCFERSGSGPFTHANQSAQATHFPTPFRVDLLPTSIGWDQADTLPLRKGHPAHGLVYGVGGNELSRFSASWEGITGFTVAGSRGSGRSTVLATLLQQLHASHRPCLVVASRTSVLTQNAEAAGIPVVGDSMIDAAAFADIFNRYKVEHSAAHSSGPVTLFVDDADLLKQTPLEFAITGIITQVSIAVAIETDAAPALFSGAFPQAKRHRKGLVLTPRSPLDGTAIFGTPIHRSMIGNRTAGSGVAHLDGAWVPLRTIDIALTPYATTARP